MNDHCLIKQDWSRKYEQSYKVPYTITKVNNNITVDVQMDNIIDTYTIRNFNP